MHLIIATVEELAKKHIDKSKEASVQVVELIKALHEQKLSYAAKLEQIVQVLHLEEDDPVGDARNLAKELRKALAKLQQQERSV